jgi:class 3 adenylate cyclase
MGTFGRIRISTNVRKIGPVTEAKRLKDADMFESKHPEIEPEYENRPKQTSVENQPSPEKSQRNIESYLAHIGSNGTGIGQAFESIWTSLSPYLPPELTSDCQNRRATKKQYLTVLSADIRGFTSLAEQTDPEDCVNILNEYFDIAVESVFEFRGDINKFQGDGFMAIFTGTLDGESHERRAVRCALRLREVARELNLPKLPGKRIPLGIGINTGIAAVGNLGSKRRSDYTAIGDVVNVAHYLQQISEPDQIIISEHTQRGMGDDLACETLGYLRVKRRINRIEAFLIC